MTTRITDNEWDELHEKSFETISLLGAVDAVDILRGGLSDDEDGRPPQLRTDLLRLHQLAMAVFNEGARSQVGDLFEFAVELEFQVDDMMAAMEQVQQTLSQLTALYPESLSYGDMDDTIDSDE
jgi:hypothetical protein